MSIKEIEQELSRLVFALMESKTIKEWDILVSQYNALSITYCRMTGEPMIIANFND